MSTIASPAPEKSCGCRRDEFGPVYCDTHRPPPLPDPPGACVLCHFIGNEPLVVGIEGVKWHESCAKD